MKTCSKCGNANADEAVFCASCGTPIDQAPVEQAPVVEAAAAPEQPAYTAPAYDSSAYSAPAAPVSTEKNTATLWLILNIVLTVLCCGNIFGIIGIILAAIGMGSYKKGDFEDMKKKTKVSMIMFIVGIVLGILALIIALASGFLIPVLAELG